MITIENPIIKTPFKDKVDFSVYIERYSLDRNVSLITAILQYCEDADVDVEKCKRLVSDSLKAKLEEEAITENYMVRRSTKLDFTALADGV